MQKETTPSGFGCIQWNIGGYICIYAGSFASSNLISYADHFLIQCGLQS